MVKTAQKIATETQKPMVRKDQNTAKKIRQSRLGESNQNKETEGQDSSEDSNQNTETEGQDSLEESNRNKETEGQDSSKLYLSDLGCVLSRILDLLKRLCTPYHTCEFPCEIKVVNRSLTQSNTTFFFLYN